MKKHYTIDVVDKKSLLKIGSVRHTEKEKNERIKELQEGGWKLENIEVKMYIQD